MNAPDFDSEPVRPGPPDQGKRQGILRAMIMLLSLGFLAVSTSGCLTSQVIENAKPISHQEESPYSFTTNDFLNVDALARKLVDATDPVSVFLTNSMQPYSRKHLAAYLAGGEDTNQIISALQIAFNDFIVREGSFYDSNRFAKVRLRPETWQPDGPHPPPYEMRRHNRRLLEDAYPAELRKMPGPKTIVDRKGEPGGYVLLVGTVPLDIATFPIQLAYFALVAYAFSHSHSC